MLPLRRVEDDNILVVWTLLLDLKLKFQFAAAAVHGDGCPILADVVRTSGRVLVAHIPRDIAQDGSLFMS